MLESKRGFDKVELLYGCVVVVDVGCWMLDVILLINQGIKQQESNIIVRLL